MSYVIQSDLTKMFWNADDEKWVSNIDQASHYKFSERAHLDANFYILSKDLSYQLKIMKVPHQSDYTE